jgi:2-oxo-3-hexenedioate decarboxylase
MTFDFITSDLLDALDTARLTQRPTERVALSLSDAYSVAARHAAIRRVRGEITIGRKIGFTNRSIWADYGIDSPLWGHMYAGGLIEAESGHAQFAIGKLVAPRIEPEIVLGLSAPVLANAEPHELAAKIAWVALGFEIVDCHYANWRFAIADVIADFGLHAGLVVGRRHAVTATESAALAAQLPLVKLTLQLNGVALSEGTGANALGSPLLALGFLADTIASHGSEPLMAGELVTTGTLTAAMNIEPGQTWRSSVDWPALAPLELELVD